MTNPVVNQAQVNPEPLLPVVVTGKLENRAVAVVSNPSTSKVARIWESICQFFKSLFSKTDSKPISFKAAFGITEAPVSISAAPVPETTSMKVDKILTQLEETVRGVQAEFAGQKGIGHLNPFQTAIRTATTGLLTLSENLTSTQVFELLAGVEKAVKNKFGKETITLNIKNILVEYPLVHLILGGIDSRLIKVKEASGEIEFLDVNFGFGLYTNLLAGLKEPISEKLASEYSEVAKEGVDSAIEALKKGNARAKKLGLAIHKTPQKTALGKSIVDEFDRSASTDIVQALDTFETRLKSLKQDGLIGDRTEKAARKELASQVDKQSGLTVDDQFNIYHEGAVNSLFSRVADAEVESRAQEIASTLVKAQLIQAKEVPHFVEAVVDGVAARPDELAKAAFELAKAAFVAKGAEIRQKREDSKALAAQAQEEAVSVAGELMESEFQQVEADNAAAALVKEQEAQAAAAVAAQLAKAEAEAAARAEAQKVACLGVINELQGQITQLQAEQLGDYNQLNRELRVYLTLQDLKDKKNRTPAKVVFEVTPSDSVMRASLVKRFNEFMHALDVGQFNVELAGQCLETQRSEVEGVLARIVERARKLSQVEDSCSKQIELLNSAGGVYVQSASGFDDQIRPLDVQIRQSIKKIDVIEFGNAISLALPTVAAPVVAAAPAPVVAAAPAPVAEPKPGLIRGLWNKVPAMPAIKMPNVRDRLPGMPAMPSFSSLNPFARRDEIIQPDMVRRYRADSPAAANSGIPASSGPVVLA